MINRMNKLKLIKFFLLSFIVSLFLACDSREHISIKDLNITTVNAGEQSYSVPTLVVIMNWGDFSEDDPTIWSDKIFASSKNSVNGWLLDATNEKVSLSPVDETDGIANDGVITVYMGTNRPERAIGSGYNYIGFVSEDITAAIESRSVTNTINFAIFDKDLNGIIDYKELQIIFIVSGGEMAYGDTADSIWAHSWNYEAATVSAPEIDGVKLMYFTGDLKTSGSYGAFGAKHSLGNRNEHVATVGIIAHEVGHSLLNLIDLYDTLYRSSGIGYFDIMSSGTWAQSDSDDYPGEAPTQYSAYSKIDAQPTLEESIVTDQSSITLKCSETSLIKLPTTRSNEYFLIECRDTSRMISDAGFMSADTTFTTDRLFSVLYHIDSVKVDNTESGEQTYDNHYRVAVVQKSHKTTMAQVRGIKANFYDVFLVGDLMDSRHTTLYGGLVSNYTIEVVSEDTTNRTMTFQISK